MEGKAKTPARQAVQLMYPICSFLDCIDFVMSQSFFYSTSSIFCRKTSCKKKINGIPIVM
ncbi:hypothetical protein FE314_16100 [Priestia megaterium]|nr:hypothetical protein FE314_16100 [Priestia megaterium]MDR4218917.1 hypothetical protein [Priestia megaterium]QCR26472.1 hypothetical protein C1N54_06320 [Priestia megaterium]RFB30745.1 hypothetical protein DZB87_09805 [Bacillus sp. ALD]RFB39852.1 hypothetical protein DZB86_03155 [Bacillus sp. RC]